MQSRAPSPHFSSRAMPAPRAAGLRGSVGSLRRRRVLQFAEGTAGDALPAPAPLTGQRRRIQEFQKRWERIRDDLPPQLTRSHIGMISIGGVIGTGLFLGSGAALHNGGPVGALIGYFIIGSVVYCLCVSIGEMIAFLPNVGGVVGLADLYVDPALGFSLGWAAWYNWSVTLPAEITAAVVVTGYWNSGKIPVAALTALFLALATIINCFPSRVYGSFEYHFSAIKVVTIVCIIVLTLVIDLGAGSSELRFFDTWKHPFADSYLGITGAAGRFLGFWAVLLQASFSFFGSEVPGIAAGEVIDATRNVPRALQRVWIRITLFYLGGIFCAGLLVDRDDPDLTNQDNSGTVRASPFVIAFQHAGMHWVSHVINAAVLLSAWSAAASDIYISSRFLFFLARQRHAPQIFASLLRYPRVPRVPQAPPEAEPSESGSDAEDEHGGAAEDVPEVHVDGPDDAAWTPEELYGPLKSPQLLSTQAVHVSVYPVSGSTSTLASGSATALPATEDGVRQPTPCPPPTPPEEDPADARAKPWFVLPLNAVLGSAAVGLLAFLNITGVGAQTAFNWMISVTSIASLQSWAGMMFTYIRWHQGTVHAENKYMDAQRLDIREEDLDDSPDADKIRKARLVIRQIQTIRVHRHRGQPYLAWWAFGICMLILFTNGWSVFLHTGWRIADVIDEEPKEYPSEQRPTDPVSNFLASYVPIPFFFLLLFGYKLIYQTRMISLDEMDFSRVNVDEDAQHDPEYTSPLARVLGWLLVS
ncbi:amino acid permease-domain-containing protein [Phanerochaete sordida]|uniref:Amino acid permease-domain-containing protein n=1 Tax=Phanerochaete sordida TaxID=48140 RepID=A0A9P3GB77_9APHY|nr:amino acid permease-domain-containing protein [Phanerochaete sordida]